ncbi:MAG: aminopeptidase [Halobacteriovorax sp.]|nr:aminopeptidase [Halobacteriovorax sp.]
MFKTDLLKTLAVSGVALTTLAHVHNHSITQEINDSHPFIVIGSDMADSSKSLSSFTVIENHGDSKIAIVGSEEKGQLSHIAHEDHKRCGGYFAFETLEKAQNFVKDSKVNAESTQKAIFADYNLDQRELVESKISLADELSIRNTILKLSSYHNRYYKSQTGQDSQAWLKSHWESLTAHRNDITVDYFEHASWPQKSVVATIQGTEGGDEVIIVGGHADSIAGWWGQAGKKAPGADDNASGTATFTEVLRVLAESGYQPKKTIQFMAYAAEEVGLLGSKEIARSYKAQNKNVIGVLQLDMTNFNGSSNDISIVSDYTNDAQNTFLKTLIDTYLTDLTWATSRCGYACSDHASWTSQGFPASIPFEAQKNDMNRRIHTANDTIEQSGGTAEHALKFAKLALAYVIELDN